MNKDFEDDLRPEYDFSPHEGVRGKYVKRYRAGASLVSSSTQPSLTHPNPNEVLSAFESENGLSLEHSSGLEGIFGDYLESSFTFEQDVVIKMFSKWGKQKLSNERVTTAGVARELQWWLKIKEFADRSPKHNQSLGRFVAALEAQSSIVSYRANYLLTIPVFLGLLSPLAANVVELLVDSRFTIHFKALFFVGVLLLSISSISDAWKLKKLSARVQSFLVIAKSVLADKQN